MYNYTYAHVDTHFLMYLLQDFQMDLFFSESGHEIVLVLFAIFCKVIANF